MTAILITGADGFVGRHLVAALRHRLPDATLHTDPFDLTDADATARAVVAARPDTALNLAGIAALSDASADPAHAWAVNLHGALTLARALLAHAPACRLIHISSADIYGASFKRGTPLDEHAVLAPLNLYAATKAAADLALGAMQSNGLDLIRLRPFNHTGPGQRPQFAVPAFARQIALIEAGRQPPHLSVGDLDPERDLLDVRDVVRAYAEAAARPLPRGLILNIASGHPRRIGDILDELIGLAGLAPTIETDPTRLRPNDIPRACGDATAARSLLGWSPEIAWSQTLSDVLADWRVRTRHANTAL